MTGFTRSCPAGPGLAQPWTDVFPVPIVMMNIPTRFMGRSHARKQFELPENPHVCKIIWMLQKGVVATGCVGTGESEKGETFGTFRIITSYRKDVDKLVRTQVPRSEMWEKKTTMIRQYIRANGHQSLEFLRDYFEAPLKYLIGEFTEYRTAVAATGHTCSLLLPPWKTIQNS
eukprot:10343312-Heterocapsa_arctica.AAC.1